MPERPIGAVSKTVVALAGYRGFESHPLRRVNETCLRAGFSLFARQFSQSAKLSTFTRTLRPGRTPAPGQANRGQACGVSALPWRSILSVVEGCVLPCPHYLETGSNPTLSAEQCLVINRAFFLILDSTPSYIAQAR